MGGSPFKSNTPNSDLHKKLESESPMPSIIILLMLVSVLAVVVLMFKDQIKDWLNAKNISLSDDLLLESNDETKSLPEPTQEKIIESQQTTNEPIPSTQIIFELAQPQLEENAEVKP